MEKKKRNPGFSNFDNFAPTRSQIQILGALKTHSTRSIDCRGFFSKYLKVIKTHISTAFHCVFLDFPEFLDDFACFFQIFVDFSLIFHDFPVFIQLVINLSESLLLFCSFRKVCFICVTMISNVKNIKKHVQSEKTLLSHVLVSKTQHSG